MCKTLSVGDDALEDSATNHLTKSRLCTTYQQSREKKWQNGLTSSLDKSHSDIVDAKRGAVRRDN